MHYLLIITVLGIFLQLIVTINAVPRQKRIIMGENSTMRDFPYIVALENKFGHMCGGSIISPLYVVTAAHCVDSESLSELRVRAGSSFRGRGGSLHRVQNYTTHDDFKSTDHTSVISDIAIIRLKKPIKFDSTKQPIPMLESGEEVNPGSDAIMAGWGCTKPYGGAGSPQLQSLGMKIVDRKKCAGIYEYMSIEKELHRDQLCASASATDKATRGACRGDSGGPLVVDGTLVGVVAARGLTYDSKQWPNRFTKISDYRDWIGSICEPKKSNEMNKEFIRR